MGGTMRGRKRGRGDERREEREVQRVGEEGGTGKKKRTTGGVTGSSPSQAHGSCKTRQRVKTRWASMAMFVGTVACSGGRGGRGRARLLRRRRMHERQLARHEDITREDHKKKAKEKAAESSNGGTSLDNAGTFMGAVVRGG